MAHYNRFAFGYDTVDDCPCPATAAGYNPMQGDDSTTVAEEYDDIIYEERDTAEGTVDAATAREAWLEAVRRIERRNSADDYWTDKAEVGREIAAELGWE